MKNLLIYLIFIISSSNLTAQDSSFVHLNNACFNTGDTINIESILSNFQKEKINVATLHLWIENTQTHQLWKFRYPILKGKNYAHIAIDSSIPKGNYAFNFVVQKDFLNIEGVIKKYKKKDTSLYFVLHTKNNWSYKKSIKIDNNGHFAINRILFEDSAFFSFISQKNNFFTEPEIINVKSTLDSSFTPDIVYTKIIAIGQANSFTELNTNYKLNIGSFLTSQSGRGSAIKIKVYAEPSLAKINMTNLRPIPISGITNPNSLEYASIQTINGLSSLYNDYGINNNITSMVQSEATYVYTEYKVLGYTPIISVWKK